MSGTSGQRRPRILLVSWALQQDGALGAGFAAALAAFLQAGGAQVVTLTCQAAEGVSSSGPEVIRVAPAAYPHDPIINRWPMSRLNAPDRWPKRFEASNDEPGEKAEAWLWKTNARSAAQRLHARDQFDLAVAVAGPWVSLGVVRYLGQTKDVPFAMVDTGGWSTWFAEDKPSAVAFAKRLDFELAGAVQVWMAAQEKTIHSKLYTDLAHRVTLLDQDGLLDGAVAQVGNWCLSRVVAVESSGQPDTSLPMAQEAAANHPPSDTDHGTKVLVATDLPQQKKARAATDQEPALVAVDCQAAADVVKQELPKGQTAADLVFPPTWNPGRMMDKAGPKDPRYSSAIGAATQPDDPVWLKLGQDTVQVADGVLPPLAQQAFAERLGPPRQNFAAGEGRLLIAQANFSAQGKAWANAVSQHVPGFEASNLQGLFQYPIEYVFEADLTIDGPAMSEALVRADLALDLVMPATHVLVEDLWPVLGCGEAAWFRRSRDAGRLDTQQILASGRQAAVVIHGSAGRTPWQHSAIYPTSPLADAAAAHTKALASQVDSLHRALADLDVPRFVTTLDMIDFVPGAKWLPIVVSPADLAPAPPWEPGQRLKVAHAPSSGLLKGSHWIDQQMGRLEELGVIEYSRITGVAPERMPGLLRQMDVVIDQIVLGNVGVLAVQTMAAGRISLGLLTPGVRRRYPVDPPLISVDPLTLSDVVWQIAKDPASFQSLAAAGPTFARQFHDGRLAAQVLAQEFLLRKAISQ
ncbi:MAG: hypothetical protein FWG16_00015 [Micrococcales bacterium]|nr:hypothetical protein [Micrococcales bacterium]